LKQDSNEKRHKITHDTAIRTSETWILPNTHVSDTDTPLILIGYPYSADTCQTSIGHFHVFKNNSDTLSIPH
jgi:hypothetical protein